MPFGLANAPGKLQQLMESKDNLILEVASDTLRDKYY